MRIEDNEGRRDYENGKILRRKGKFVIAMVADGYSRKYIEDDLEVAKARPIK